ncbi:hypothetical protein DPMN_117291 [Dreissena polymorpha]|uniref:DDE-1 domain-containing protein n=1 Tax=Dreissena polymorpha TaxID=45954 RepID=A0A9D4KQ79_DREPO|nr:hypothetical protein DPMN_117291 [Dreissena polymorpha]
MFNFEKSYRLYCRTRGLPTACQTHGNSWTEYIDHELFQTWFIKGFLSQCWRARPVVMIMDNHDAHISLPVIEAARAKDVALIGFPDIPRTSCNRRI